MNQEITNLLNQINSNSLKKSLTDFFENWTIYDKNHQIKNSHQLKQLFIAFASVDGLRSLEKSLNTLPNFILEWNSLLPQELKASFYELAKKQYEEVLIFFLLSLKQFILNKPATYLKYSEIDVKLIDKLIQKITSHQEIDKVLLRKITKTINLVIVDWNLQEKWLSDDEETLTQINNLINENVEMTLSALSKQFSSFKQFLIKKEIIPSNLKINEEDNVIGMRRVWLKNYYQKHYQSITDENFSIMQLEMDLFEEFMKENNSSSISNKEFNSIIQQIFWNLYFKSSDTFFNDEFFSDLDNSEIAELYHIQNSIWQYFIVNFNDLSSTKIEHLKQILFNTFSKIIIEALNPKNSKEDINHQINQQKIKALAQVELNLDENYHNFLNLLTLSRRKALVFNKGSFNKNINITKHWTELDKKQNNSFEVSPNTDLKKVDLIDNYYETIPNNLEYQIIDNIQYIKVLDEKNNPHWISLNDLSDINGNLNEITSAHLQFFNIPFNQTIWNTLFNYFNVSIDKEEIFMILDYCRLHFLCEVKQEKSLAYVLNSHSPNQSKNNLAKNWLLSQKVNVLSYYDLFYEAFIDCINPSKNELKNNASLLNLTLDELIIKKFSNILFEQKMNAYWKDKSVDTISQELIQKLINNQLPSQELAWISIHLKDIINTSISDNCNLTTAYLKTLYNTEKLRFLQQGNRQDFFKEWNDELRNFEYQGINVWSYLTDALYKNKYCDRNGLKKQDSDLQHQSILPNQTNWYFMFDDEKDVFGIKRTEFYLTILKNSLKNSNKKNIEELIKKWDNQKIKPQDIYAKNEIILNPLQTNYDLFSQFSILDLSPFEKDLFVCWFNLAFDKTDFYSDEGYITYTFNFLKNNNADFSEYSSIALRNNYNSIPNAFDIFDKDNIKAKIQATSFKKFDLNNDELNKMKNLSISSNYDFTQDEARAISLQAEKLVLLIASNGNEVSNKKALADEINSHQINYNENAISEFNADDYAILPVVDKTKNETLINAIYELQQKMNAICKKYHLKYQSKVGSKFYCDAFLQDEITGEIIPVNFKYTIGNMEDTLNIITGFIYGLTGLSINSNDKMLGWRYNFLSNAKQLFLEDKNFIDYTDYYFQVFFKNPYYEFNDKKQLIFKQKILQQGLKNLPNMKPNASSLANFTWLTGSDLRYNTKERFIKIILDEINKALQLAQIKNQQGLDAINNDYSSIEILSQVLYQLNRNSGSKFKDTAMQTISMIINEKLVSVLNTKNNQLLFNDAWKDNLMDLLKAKEEAFIDETKLNNYITKLQHLFQQVWKRWKYINKDFSEKINNEEINQILKEKQDIEINELDDKIFLAVKDTLINELTYQAISKNGIIDIKQNNILENNEETLLIKNNNNKIKVR